MLEFDGLVKLVEECGELTQIAAKKITRMDTDIHYDGKSLSERLENEIADVIAACSTVARNFGLSKTSLAHLKAQKEMLFKYWQDGGQETAIPEKRKKKYQKWFEGLR